jgi:6-phosphogluconate dehydrogenase
MQLGIIGLGRMGANIARRLMKGGQECVVYNRTPEKVAQLVKEGAIGAKTIEDLVIKLKKPRTVWIMLPAGDPTEQMLQALTEIIEQNDIIIDGGNSHYKDDVRRAAALKAKGIHYLDVGTSGGVWGLKRGYCMMIGGEKKIAEQLEPIFETLTPGPGNVSRTPGREHKKGTAEKGFLYCGPAGAGHFVKMIHNGIEYGLMEAYAEGFDILKSANKANLPEDCRYDFDVADIAEVWRRGSVIGSWLLDLTAQAFIEDPDLSGYTGSVQDSGEGRWTIMAAIEASVPADVLSVSLYKRFRSQQAHTFAEKLLSAMREKFGGHVERPEKD